MASFRFKLTTNHQIHSREHWGPQSHNHSILGADIQGQISIPVPALRNIEPLIDTSCTENDKFLLRSLFQILITSSVIGNG